MSLTTQISIKIIDDHLTAALNKIMVDCIVMGKIDWDIRDEVMAYERDGNTPKLYTLLLYNKNKGNIIDIKSFENISDKMNQIFPRLKKEIDKEIDNILGYESDNAKTG